MHGALVGLIEYGEGFFADPSPLGCSLSRVLAQVFEQHHEFVPPQTGYSIALADAGGETLGNLLQQQVAFVVTEGVVENFEIVEIDEEECTFAATAGA